MNIQKVVLQAIRRFRGLERIVEEEGNSNQKFPLSYMRYADFSLEVDKALNAYLQGTVWFAVIVTDVAGVNYVAKKYGREKGGELIAIAAEILSKSPVTQGDILTWGGSDEFQCLLVDESKDDIMSRLEEVRSHIYTSQEAINSQGHLPIEFCIGVGIVSSEDSYVPKVISESDTINAAGEIVHEAYLRSVTDKERQGVYDRNPALEANHYRYEIGRHTPKRPQKLPYPTP